MRGTSVPSQPQQPHPHAQSIPPLSAASTLPSPTTPCHIRHHINFSFPTLLDHILHPFFPSPNLIAAHSLIPTHKLQQNGPKIEDIHSPLVQMSRRQKSRSTIVNPSATPVTIVHHTRVVKAAHKRQTAVHAVYPENPGAQIQIRHSLTVQECKRGVHLERSAATEGPGWKRWVESAQAGDGVAGLAKGAQGDIPSRRARLLGRQSGEGDW
ncbi:hypothetical protein MMC16_007103 [Acarospora aff. strigata]|nr:hypothetical protein [Acarospora aff. strigata]